MNEFVLNLADPQASLDLVGGKGASLARLAQADLPVPGGFHVTTGSKVYRSLCKLWSSIPERLRVFRSPPAFVWFLDAEFRIGCPS